MHPAERLAQTLSLAIEELIGELENDPTLGDNGVAELVIKLDNYIPLIRVKIGENLASKEASRG